MYVDIRFDQVTLFDGESIKTDHTLLIKGEKFLWIGPTADLDENIYQYGVCINASKLYVLPGFIDSHIHLLRSAISSLGYDFSKVTDQGSPGFFAKLKEISMLERPELSSWVVGYFLDESNPEIQNVINREYVDRILPNVPFVLHFKSGHGYLLNTVALERLGIQNNSVEPSGVTFQRSLIDGTLTGVIYEGQNILSGRISSIPQEAMTEAVVRFNRLLISRGITSVVDCSPGNNWKRFLNMQDRIQSGEVTVDVVFMVGAEFIKEFIENEVKFGEIRGGVQVGHVKIVITASSGRLHPNAIVLNEIIRYCHDQGYPVAIHAVERDAVNMAVDILSKYPFHGDRLEHVSELEDATLHKLHKTYVSVSAQPGFILHHGDRYIRETPSSDVKYLHRIGSMVNTGIHVGYSSDSPVTFPDPMESLYVASTRVTSQGAVLNQLENVSKFDSMRAITSVNAKISGLSVRKGWIQSGYEADMVAMTHDPFNHDLNDSMEHYIKFVLRRGKILSGSF